MKDRLNRQNPLRVTSYHFTHPPYDPLTAVGKYEIPSEWGDWEGIQWLFDKKKNKEKVSMDLNTRLGF